MKKSLVRVLASLGLLALVAGVAPAAAGALGPAPRATASVDVHQALAGAQQAFTITVGNPVTGVLAPIRSVRIIAPGELFSIAAPVDPLGWTGTVTGGGSTLTYKATGGGLGGGTSQAFSFVADTLRPATDLSRSWSVSTSTDTGTTTTYQAATGALGVRVRTLEVLGVAVVAPEQLVGDPSLHVTAGQSNVTVGVRVANAGSAPQTVTATLTGATASVAGGAPVELGAGAIETVLFDVAFADALGHGKLVANATAGESVAAQRFLAYVADEPIELALDPDNQTPKVVVPGRTASFSNYLAVRGAADAPAIDIDPVLSEYRFADGAVRAPLGAALHLEAGNGQWLPPTPPIVIPALADGPYSGVLHIEGVDAHGAAVSTDLPLRSGSLVVDSLAPIADLVLGEPGQVGTINTRIPLSGSIVDRDGACGACALADAEVQVFDAAGAMVSSFVLYSQLCEDEGSPAGGCQDGWTNDDGAVGGWITPVENEQWPTTATSVRVVTSVVDDLGLSSTSASTPVDIDLVAPSILGATTADTRTVAVQLSEPVAAPAGFAPGDWICDGQPAGAAADGDTVVLSLAGELGRNATPTCAYAPLAARAEDRAGFPLANGSVTAADGIAPLAPVVAAPAFTNTSTPVLSVSAVDTGDLVNVLEDGFVVGGATADGTSIDVTTDSLGAIDRVVHLEVVTTDPAGNVGPAVPVEITLDFTAPALTGAAVQRTGGQVTVTFAEPLVGPDAVDDWHVRGGSVEQPLTSADVEGAVVTLTVQASGATAPLDQVRYEVLAADGSTRLTDRAGNIVADAVTAF